jgi:hypothetical protein
MIQYVVPLLFQIAVSEYSMPCVRRDDDVISIGVA